MRTDHVTRISHQRELGRKIRSVKIALVLLACLVAVCTLGSTRVVSSSASIREPNESSANVKAIFEKHCFQCHGLTAPQAGVNLEQLVARDSIGDNFQLWERVAVALEQKAMPPEYMPQPSDAERSQIVSWIRTELNAYAKKHDGDPGPVTLRRLTSGEYAYTIKDLTGLDLNVGIDSASDSVGGEGFTNFGDVQFMQDANLERYLGAAKIIADHAVIGSGPLEFSPYPGKTGFELSAISRIKDIYAAHGIRTVSGEGGRPFGIEKYGKALYVAWRYEHRAALGEANATLKDLAAREKINLRFAQHIWRVVNNPSLKYPSSEVASRWRKLSAPETAGDTSAEAARIGCEEIQKFLITWPSWLFARGDLAAGGAGDESPLEFSDRTLNVKTSQRFIFVRNGRRDQASAPGPAKIYLNVAPVNPAMGEKPVVIWRNLTVGFRPLAPRPPVAEGKSAVVLAQDAKLAADLRQGIVPPGPRQPLRTLVTEEIARKLNFGKSPDGTLIGPNDFATEGSAMFEVPMPEGPVSLNLQVDAELGSNREQVVRIVIADRADGVTRGQPTRALMGDMKSAAYQEFRAGVMEFASLMPPNSHAEPTPADKDPVPDPFDNTYNVPEHDEFVQKVKYIRDDQFVIERLVDDATRRRLDHAWNDLYASFEYHDNYLRLLASHFKFDLKGKGIAQMDKAQTDAMPAEMRKYVRTLRGEYNAVLAAQAAARPGHIEDCLNFASRAWRRPLTEREKQNLRSFYEATINATSDHRKAIHVLLARILIAPQFLYRVEQVTDTSSIEQTNYPSVKPLTNWEVASRLSYFLWSSIPDDELRRAAGAGELNEPQGLRRQVKRMVADPKARRLSTEFFGQWLGFYHFDRHNGVDTSRFTEFTDDVKKAMYDEAVSFFEHVIRKNRPIGELLFADYTFLNKDLAKFYGVKREIKSVEQAELVEGAGAFHRGGLLRLGAVLTATSAPLRTSPVKRGDWILRRILGTPVPPPPADAGSIPADDKLFGGLTVKARLEQHKRNASCASCHTRIDPLGFSLERYDSTGRWRDQYSDGKQIEDSAALSDQTPIAGVDGLLNYLRGKDSQVRRTFSRKLVGYALGRTVMASDQLLIDRMVAAGGDATFAQLATEIVASKQFRHRLGQQESLTPSKVAVNSAVRNSNQGVSQ